MVARLHRARYGIIACYAGPAAGGGGGTTTFDPAHLGSEFTLSGGNLIATDGAVDTFNFNVARSIASHSTGKLYNEFIPTGGSWPDAYDASIGITNASTSVNVKLGNDTNSFAYYNNEGQIFINAVGVGPTLPPYVSGNVVGMAVDIGNLLLWLRVAGGNWNGSSTANPATATGGISLSTMTGGGPFYAAAVSFTNDPNPIWTANFGGSAYANAAPSGFGNW